MTGRTISHFIGLACITAGAGFLLTGCSGNRSRRGSPAVNPSSSPAPGSQTAESQRAQRVMESASFATVSPTLATEAVLSQISATDFAVPTDLLPFLTATGTPNAGTVSFDFGLGVDIQGATYEGSLSADYAATPTTASFTVTYTGFAKTTPLYRRGMDGTLSVSVSQSGSNATMSLSGNLTTTRDSDTNQIALSMTVDIDGATGTSTMNGTAQLDSPTYGSWTLSTAGLSYDSASTCIVSGTVVLTSPTPGVSATYSFTGPDTGTVTLTGAAGGGTFAL